MFCKKITFLIVIRWITSRRPIKQTLLTPTYLVKMLNSSRITLFQHKFISSICSGFRGNNSGNCYNKSICPWVRPSVCHTLGIQFNVRRQPHLATSKEVWRVSACSMRMLRIRITGDWESRPQSANPVLPENGRYNGVYVSCVRDCNAVISWLGFLSYFLISESINNRFLPNERSSVWRHSVDSARNISGCWSQRAGTRIAAVLLCC